MDTRIELPNKWDAICGKSIKSVLTNEIKTLSKKKHVTSADAKEMTALFGAIESYLNANAAHPDFSERMKFLNKQKEIFYAKQSNKYSQNPSTLFFETDSGLTKAHSSNYQRMEDEKNKSSCCF